MVLPYYPKRGEVLICDFDTGFRAPEMVKTRPVIVLSRKDSHVRRLCTVIPVSTTRPDPVERWHYPIPRLVIPGWKSAAQSWAKCDMLSTVGFARLNKPYDKGRHGRRYVEVTVTPEDLAAIEGAVRAYLAL